MLIEGFMNSYERIANVFGWIILCLSAIAGLVIGIKITESFFWRVFGLLFGAFGGFLFGAVLLAPGLFLFKIYDRLDEIAVKMKYGTPA